MYCSQSVFVLCIVLRTVVITLFGINRLVFITETECLLRGRRMELFYNTFQVHLNL